MCVTKIGKVIKILGEEALVDFGNKTEKINVSLIKDLKVNDKIVCSGKIGIEKLD